MLFADGELLKTVEKGDRVTSEPTPVGITFQGIDAKDLSRLKLQIATRPVATSGGQVNNPTGRHGTLYGSVQFPARLTLP